jgi:hypothetical protein
MPNAVVPSTHHLADFFVKFPAALGSILSGRQSQDEDEEEADQQQQQPPQQQQQSNYPSIPAGAGGFAAANPDLSRPSAATLQQQRQQEDMTPVIYLG